ncbi:MAG: hypothetical protein ACJ74Z_18335 [Bryobacteraceae bacterium]
MYRSTLGDYTRGIRPAGFFPYRLRTGANQKYNTWPVVEQQSTLRNLIANSFYLITVLHLKTCEMQVQL